MNLRRDLALLKALVAKDLISEEVALKRISLPLIEIPFNGVLKDGEGKTTQWIEGDPWSEYIANDVDSEEIFEALMEPPFDEFLTVMYSEMVTVYTYFRNLSEDGLSTYHECYFINNDNPSIIPIAVIGMGQQESPGSDMVKYSLTARGATRLSNDEKMRIIAESRWTTAAWIVFNSHRSLTMVTQELPNEKVGKKAGFNARLNSSKKVNVIFLDRLPTKSSSVKNVADMLSECSRKPHSRIGHRRVLKHPRFQNHPKYLDPKGIFIRGTWIGEKQSVDAVGTVYTVHPSQLSK